MASLTQPSILPHRNSLLGSKFLQDIIEAVLKLTGLKKKPNQKEGTLIIAHFFFLPLFIQTTLYKTVLKGILPQTGMGYTAIECFDWIKASIFVLAFLLLWINSIASFQHCKFTLLFSLGFWFHAHYSILIFPSVECKCQERLISNMSRYQLANTNNLCFVLEVSLVKGNSWMESYRILWKSLSRQTDKPKKSRDTGLQCVCLFTGDTVIFKVIYILWHLFTHYNSFQKHLQHIPVLYFHSGF